MRTLCIAVILLAVVAFSAAWADERTEPIDVIIALDKSLSMVEEIGAVKAYVDTYVIDDLLIPGDFFLVVAFYGETEVPVSMTIEDQADKERAKRLIDGLMANGQYTDIGNALDVLEREIRQYSHPDREKYLLLITDGIQEAPPGSRYYSPDGKFNHELLENTKTIQKKGWKVVVLGVGTEEQSQELAQELAQEMGAEYAPLSKEPTAEELAEKTREFLSTLKAAPGIRFGPIRARGGGSLEVTVSSEGYEEEKTVEVSSILLTLPGKPPVNILPGPVAWRVPPGESAALSARVRLPEVPPPGEHSGTLEFRFTSSEHFVPVVMPVEFRVLSFVGSYWLWIVIGAAVLVLVIILIILLAVRPGKAKYRFRLVVEGQPSSQGKDVYRIVEGKPQYLEQADGHIRISATRGPGSLARLNAIQKGVRMGLLKPERFPKLTDMPLNVLDFDFRVRVDLDKKQDVTVRLSSAG